MVGAIIGASIGAIGSILGASQSARAAREAERQRLAGLDKQEKRANDQYNYELGLPRYAADRLLQKTADRMAKRKAEREAKRKMIGGTQASVQGEIDSENEALGNAAQDAIAAGLEGRKESTRKHTETLNSIDAQRSNVVAESQMARANATAQAVSGVAQAAGSLAGAINSGGAGKTRPAGITGAIEQPENEIKPISIKSIAKDAVGASVGNVKRMM